MPQPHPPRQLLLPARQAKHIPQRPNLQLVEILVHRILHQRLKFKHSLFNLQSRLFIRRVAIFVESLFPPFGCVAIREAQERRVRG